MNNNFPLFAQCTLSQPVTQEGIVELEKQLKQPLPSEYKRLLQFSNGFEGWLGKQVYVQIWPAEQTIPNTKACEADKMIPGILLIGATNTGEAICLDLREASPTYKRFFMLPFDPFDWDESELLGYTVEEAFTRLQNPFSIPQE